MKRDSCAEVASFLRLHRALSGHPTWQLAGRVIACEEGRFQLADSSASVRVRLRSGAAVPNLGDIVAVRVTLAEGEQSVGVLVAEEVTLLTSRKSVAPFPHGESDYWRAQQGKPSRVDRLRLRSRALAAVRAFFEERDYVEVQTPLRVRSPGLEPYLHAEPSGDRYLITSPEFHLKRLLSIGLERIYSLGPCWRREEEGAHHLGEFTMLEWYQAYSSTTELMDEVETLVRHVAETINGRSRIFYDGWPMDLGEPFLAHLRSGSVRALREPPYSPRHRRRLAARTSAYCRSGTIFGAGKLCRGVFADPRRPH